jgi:hypothetical protein
MPRRRGSPLPIFSFAVTFAVHMHTCLHSDVDTVYLNKRIMKDVNRIKPQRMGFIVVWIRRMLPAFRSNVLSSSSGWNRCLLSGRFMFKLYYSSVSPCDPNVALPRSFTDRHQMAGEANTDAQMHIWRKPSVGFFTVSMKRVAEQ